MTLVCVKLGLKIVFEVIRVDMIIMVTLGDGINIILKLYKQKEKNEGPRFSPCLSLTVMTI